MPGRSWRKGHCPTAGEFRLRVRRLYPRWAVAGEHCRLDVLRRDFRLVGGGYGVYRQRDDPGDGEEGLSARIRGGGDGQRVGAGDSDPAQPQLGDLLPGGGGTVSIATLFIAGVLPGLLLGVSLMVLCLCFARKRGYPKGDKIPFRQALKIMLDALWGLMTVVIILGGILSGIFTATESAAVACLWAFFVTMFIYRDYKWSELPKLMCRTVKTVTIVMILIGFAAAFGAVMTYMQLPMRITEFFTSLSDNKYVILMYLNIMLLLIGTLMDMAPIILILTPVLLPVTNALGIDPVHFGMIMMVNLGIGLITPPVGSVLFVASAVSKQKIEHVVRAMLPFYGMLLVVLGMVTYIPAISLWLPGLLGMQ